MVGESSEPPQPPGSHCSSMSGCQMTVVGAAAGTSAVPGHGAPAACFHVLCPPEGCGPRLLKAASVAATQRQRGWLWFRGLWQGDRGSAVVTTEAGHSYEPSGDQKCVSMCCG